VAAVPHLRAIIDPTQDDFGLKRAVLAAIASIQARADGAEQGQLALTEGEAGDLALSEHEAGQVSLADEEG
jgi:hypothetical protein